MLRGIAMTRCACYSGRLERRAGILIPRLWQRRLHFARMTMQAIGVDRKRVRHAPSRSVIGCHVPELLSGVVIHRRLEPPSILLEEICPAAPPRANVIRQQLPSMQSRSRVGHRPVIDHPRLTLPQDKLVANARWRVREPTFDQSVGRNAAAA